MHIPLRSFCVFISILALSFAKSKSRPSKWNFSENSIKNSWKATDWLPISELESLPSMHEMTLKMLEKMSVQEGAELIQKMYHLSQAGWAFEPTYAPKPDEIPALYITPDNKKVILTLNKLAEIPKEEKEFGNEEITIYITGLPETTETIKKSKQKLVEAFMKRYNGQLSKIDYDDRTNSSSSEENAFWQNNSKIPSGNLIVIELGKILENIQQYVTLDIEKTGMIIGEALLQLTKKNNIPHEILHLIGSNIGAHVAGAAGRHFTRKTGHKLQRITGLDPSRIFARADKTLTGLARGDAEFVDVIHTSAYGLGTPARCGDVDFYPNGPSDGVPGADNVVEASMRAIRYFAESVLPGNEHNFPAVAATSLKQYKNDNGNGKRIYMGINTNRDSKGDFILQVNSKSLFGKSSPAHKQEKIHNIHMPWKMISLDI